MSRWSARSSGLLSANTTGLVTECRPSSSRYDGERTASRANERGIAARTTGATAQAARKRTRWQSPTKPVWFPGGLDGQSRPNVRRLPIAEAELIRAFRGGGARLRAGGFAVRRRRPGFRPRPGHDAGSCSPRSLRRSLDRTGQFGVRQFGVTDNSVSVHHYGRANSVSVHHYESQFVVSSSLLLPLETIRCQFIIIASPASSRGANSVSVHHYCFPCIKSVSWIHERDNSV